LITRNAILGKENASECPSRVSSPRYFENLPYENEKNDGKKLCIYTTKYLALLP